MTPVSFKAIKKIITNGPTSKPIIPNNCRPMNMEINVGKVDKPIWSPINLGSTTRRIISKIAAKMNNFTAIEVFPINRW